MKVAFKTADSARVRGVLPSVALVRVSGQHLTDLPNTRFAVRARLTAFLDLSEAARTSANFFRDAAVGDTLADADEHGWLA
jgi:hypothetical protein